MPRSASYHEGLVKHLQDPLEAASYIEVVLEEGDPKMLGKALKNVIEAQGGIDRFPAPVKQSYEQLDLMLSEQGEIEFYCLSKLLDALGLQLAVRDLRFNNVPMKFWNLLLHTDCLAGILFLRESLTVKSA